MTPPPRPPRSAETPVGAGRCQGRRHRGGGSAASALGTTSGAGAGAGADRRAIGLFDRGNLTVEKFKRENPAAVQADEPTLPEMTENAIGLLAGSAQARGRGFFLQVEEALIDKRSHANDAGQTLDSGNTANNSTPSRPSAARSRTALVTL